MTNWRVLVPIGIALALWAGFAFRDTVPSVSLGQSAAVNPPCRPTAAEIAATEIATTAYPTTTMTPTPVTAPEVTTELAVLVGDQEIPLLLPSLVIRAPLADQPEINELLHTSLIQPTVGATGIEPDAPTTPTPSLDESVARNPYRTLLIQLLMSDPSVAHDIGVLSGSTEGNARAILRDAIGITDPPLLGVSENGTVTLVIPQSAKVLADKTEEIAGGWTVASSGRDISFLFDGQPSASTAWTVGVCTDGLPIVLARLAYQTPTPTSSSVARQTPAALAAQAQTLPPGTSTPGPATPALSFQNSNRVSWSAPAAAAPTRVEVIAQASPLAALRMWMFTHWKPLVTALALVVPVLLFLAGAYLLARVSGQHRDLATAQVALTDTPWAILRLALAVVAFSIIVELFNSAQFAPVQIETLAGVALPPTPTPQLASAATATPGAPSPEDWINLPYRAFYDETATRLQWPAIVGLTVLALGFLDMPRPRGGSRQRWVVELVLAVFSVVAILGCVLYLNNDSFSTMFSVISPAILIAGYTMFLATAVRTWRLMNSRSWPSYRFFLPALGAASVVLCTWVHAVRVSDDQNAFLAGAVLPLWVTACAVVGFVLLAAPIAGIRSRGDESPSRGNGLRPRVIPLRRVHWVIITTIALILAIIVQWEWANYSDENLWWRSAVEASLLDRLPEISRVHLEDPRQLVLDLPNDFNPLGVDTTLTRYPVGFFVTSLDLFLILGLVGFLLALRAIDQPRDRKSGWPLLWQSDHLWIVWVLSGLFAAFVVGYGGEILGLRAPVAFIISLIIFPWAVGSKIPDDSARIDATNKRLKGARPLIATYRGELLRRAFSLADLEKTRAAHFGNRVDKAPGSEGYLDAHAYIASLHDLTETAGAVQQGTKDREASLQIDEQDDPAELALALGPEVGWWRNGLRAAELGSRLAILPIAYFAYIFLTSAGAGRWSLTTPFAVVGLISGLAYEIAFWLVAAFAFGCLFPYLRGKNGPVKGVVLAAIYVAANAGAALLGIPGNALWQVRSFQLMLFLMLLGAWLDLQTVEAQGLRRRDLIALYDLPKSANLVSQVLPLVTALTAVVLQLFLGQTQAATTSLVSADTSRAILEFIKASSR